MMCGAKHTSILLPFSQRGSCREAGMGEGTDLLLHMVTASLVDETLTLKVSFTLREQLSS